MMPTDSSPDYSRALEVALSAATMAGTLLREDFHRAGGPRGSGGHAPADEEAERLIRRTLTEAFPTWNYLGEETGRYWPTPGASCVWLVDPNDGTSDYVKGRRGSAVSIALLRDGVPVLGVVYAFGAPDDRGDLFAWAEGCGPFRRNGVPVARAAWPTELRQYDVLILAAAANGKPLANARLAAPARFRAMPSIAYRLALVAAGDGAAAISLNAPGAWDYAAGHALVHAMGGAFVDERGRAVTYTAEGESSTRFCFAGAPALVRELAGRDWNFVLEAGLPEPEPYDLIAGRRGIAVADPELLARAHGCLLGQLAGDALGSLVEFQSAEKIARAYPHRVRTLIDGGTWNTIAGQPTDDSELALVLARSIVAAGRYEPEAAARAYRYWYRSAPFDCGATTSQALAAIDETSVAAGQAPEKARAAASLHSQSNGSLMRISPLGIWGHRLRPDLLADLARADAELTHPHPVCRDAAAVFAVAVATAIADGVPPGELYGRTLDWASAAIRERAVLGALRAAADRPPADYMTHQGWVLVALQNAFYWLLHASDVEEGVVETVMAGGDTDTNAAIAGALFGAVHGRDGVPWSWRQTVLTCRPVEGLPGVRRPRRRAFWPVDALDLAERLAAMAPAGDGR
jgi:ADP-ribosylglycohydrolase/fructose-1,6-bisphosphatase/inositol monophosphatase family enzyme